MHLCLVLATSVAVASADAFSASGAAPSAFATAATTRAGRRLDVVGGRDVRRVHGRGRRRCGDGAGVSASARDDEGSNRGAFDGGFTLRMPWDGPPPSNERTSRENEQPQGRSWWPNHDAAKSQPAPQRQSSNEERPRRQRKPRKPRYPSALQNQYARPSNVESKQSEVATKESEAVSEVVDEYVKSAEEAVKSARPTAKFNGSSSPIDREPRMPKLGILMIDHGSKRPASNERMHLVAEAYQARIDERYESVGGGEDSGGNPNVAVRAAHMEIASPSILTQLSRLVKEDGVTTAICVPYFLSPGKHAMTDIPNLIVEARETLYGEGLLEFCTTSGKTRRVKILSSKTLGSDMTSMLGVVDSLIESTLENIEGPGVYGLDFSHGKVNGDSSEARDVASKGVNGDSLNSQAEDELRKYANRAALLQNTLEAKVAQLKKMTNRAALMEDAFSRLKERREASNREKEDAARAAEERESLLGEREGQIANLTAAIEAIGKEKVGLDRQVEILEGRLVELTKGYDATIEDLSAKLASAEEELQRLQEQQYLEHQRSEERVAQTANGTKGLQEKVQEQQARIKELQSQLADLLDAHAELEQLQTDTEISLLQHKKQLRDSQAGHQSSLEAERDEKEDYRSRWTEVQSQLERDSARLEKLLNDSKAEYEVLLEEERGRVEEWRDRYQTLNETVSVGTPAKESTTEPARSDEEWASLQDELKEVMAAKEDATKKVEELELQLQWRKNETLSSSQKKDDQNKQLQEYLQAQLSTYYDTIQGQSEQISEYEKKIAEMEKRQEESMLIATNSVDASRRREEELLTNVEEMEAELAVAKKEKEEKEKEVDEARSTLKKLEESERASEERKALSSKEREEQSAITELLAEHNSDMKLLIEGLEHDVEEARWARDRAIEEKLALEKEAEERPREGRRRRWVRAVLRPWTLLRRRNRVDVE